MKERYTVECIRAGQPRPYADHIYEYYLTVEWQGMEGYKNFDAPFVPRDSSELIVRKIAKATCRDWNESGGWWEPKLHTFERLQDGRWHIIVTEAYTD